MKTLLLTLMLLLFQNTIAFAGDSDGVAKVKVDAKSTKQLDLSLPDDVLKTPSDAITQKPEISTQEKEQEELRKRCKEMSKRIEKLKGKPLRRGAMADRYKAECTNR